MTWSSKGGEIFWAHFAMKSYIGKLVFILALCVVILGSAFCSGCADIKAKDKLTIVTFGNWIIAERANINKVFTQRLPELLHIHGVESVVINSEIPDCHIESINDNNLFKICHGRDRFVTDAMSPNPNLAIIGFGTNDSYIDSKTKDGESRISFKDFKTNLEFYITQLESVDSKIILIVPNILGAKYPAFQNKRLLRHVKNERQLAGRYDTGLVYDYSFLTKYAKIPNIALMISFLTEYIPIIKGMF